MEIRNYAYRVRQVIVFYTIEGLKAITRYVGNFEFWENGVKVWRLKKILSKRFCDVSTSGLK